MTTRATFKFGGVIPACLLPFDAEFAIDERAYRKHLRDVAGVRGISAITVNGHASEVSSCNVEEQERVARGMAIPIFPSVYGRGGESQANNP